MFCILIPARSALTRAFPYPNRTSRYRPRVNTVKLKSPLNTQYRKGVHILLSGLLHVLEVKAEERVTLCLVTEDKIDCL